MTAHLPSLPSVRLAWTRRTSRSHHADHAMRAAHSPGLTGCAGGALRPRSSQLALADALRSGRL